MIYTYIKQTGHIMPVIKYFLKGILINLPVSIHLHSTVREN